MKKSIVLILLIVVLTIIASCTGKQGTIGNQGPAGPIQPGIYYVKNFQQGVYTPSYSGQIESSIYGGYSAATYTSNTEPIWFGAKAGHFGNRAIIKFDLSSIPASKIIIDKAELTLQTDEISQGGGVVGANVHKITTAWKQYQVGWYNITDSIDWIHVGGDYEAKTMTANVSSFNMTANSTITIDLDPAVVQSWTNSPSTNYGMIMIAGAETDGYYVEMYSSGAVTPSARPLLKISYYTTE
jgi:hypothetical protein